MGRVSRIRAGKALLISSLLAVAAPTYAVDSDLYLAGLGLHQETGRNIYLGGIYLERETPKSNKLTETGGERIMEYRVVARRTSIRSLLGGMLLQSEVATGNPPDEATADFADEILSTVSTSLYAGDSLEIRLTADNETIAKLNGHTLARVANKSVADYLLMGWVGESGPSTSFRDDITAEQVDPSLLSTLEANTYSEQRQAEIASWVRAEDQDQATSIEPAVATDPAPALNMSMENSVKLALADALYPIDITEAEIQERLAETQYEPLQEVEVTARRLGSGLSITVSEAPISGEAATYNIATADAVRTQAADSSGSAMQQTLELIVPNRGPMQVAALVPTTDMMPQNPLQQEVEALGIQEYSQRLSEFHSALIRKVYGAIEYPKRAVRRGLQGRLELDITMTASGDVLDVTIALSSGHALLDTAAVAAARKAFKGNATRVDPVALAEFGDFDNAQFTVPVPVSFQLQ